MTPTFTTHYMTCVLDKVCVFEESQKCWPSHMTKVKDPYSCGPAKRKCTTAFENELERDREKLAIKPES